MKERIEKEDPIIRYQSTPERPKTQKIKRNLIVP
jgi:hypothetical protein